MRDSRTVDPASSSCNHRRDGVSEVQRCGGRLKNRIRLLRLLPEMSISALRHSCAAFSNCWRRLAEAAPLVRACNPLARSEVLPDRAADGLGDADVRLGGVKQQITLEFWIKAHGLDRRGR